MNALPYHLPEDLKIIRPLAERPGQKTLLGEWLAQQVVVKTLSFSEMPAWKNLELFEREAQTLQYLEHAALPRLLDWGKGENGLYLITAYIPGETLTEKLSVGWRPNEQEIRELAEQLLKIPVFLHAHHPPLIHRDIKPKNLVLNAEGQLFLIDFGAVSQLLQPEGSSTVAGTFGYMAPEQFSGKALPQSDLYAVGATLLHLLTGRTPSELPQKRLKPDFEPYTQCSQALICWLHSLLEPHPEERCLNARIALETLKQTENKTLPIKRQAPALHLLPSNSHLQVRRESDFLQIQIPTSPLSAGLEQKERQQLIFLGARISIISMIFLINFPNPVLFASLLSPLLLVLFSSYFYEKNKFKHLLQTHTELKLTAESILITQTMPQKPQETLTIPWRRVARIEEKRKSWKLEPRGEQKELILVEHQPTLSGKTVGTGKYRFYKFGHTLNEGDRTYLLRLLQTWFNQTKTKNKANLSSFTEDSALKVLKEKNQIERFNPQQDLTAEP